MIPREMTEASAELKEALRGVVGEAHFDRLTCLLYSTDASIYQQMPLGVVSPRHADEVSAVVEVAARHGVPLLGRGGGSSLDGQATLRDGLILDMTRYMAQVVEVNAEARTVRSQPGITLGKLNRILSAYGLMFGPDPASADRATVGGIIANNSTGAHSIVYGMTGDHVIGLDVVLADASRVRFDALTGETWADRARRPGLEGGIYRAVPAVLERYREQIETRYPGTWRTAAGYNLNHVVENGVANPAKLIVQSESTLALITEATLNLVPVPKKRRLVLVHFSTLRAALEAVPVMLESGPTAIELIDEMMLTQTRDKPEYRRLLTFIEGEPAVVLITEYSGDSDAELDAGVDRLKTILARLNHHDPAPVVADPKGQANVWYVRKVGLGLLMSIKGDAKPLPFIEDVAVPVQHLADYVTDVLDIVQEAGLSKVGIYAHASAGCLHLRPVINLKTAEGLRQMRQIGEGVVELVKKYRGSISGEHGEGLARGEFSARIFGPELVQAFREVKAAFDPQGIMNPGKIVDAPKMDDMTLLRFGTDYATPQEPSATVFSYAIDGGFARAVEMCNGAGVCRKPEQGVMCPSFMATGDEAQSTRGRANALRAGIMGLLGPDGVTSPEVYEVMDLCLSCKACKAECPSSVDMAKLKSEFLHLYHQRHGTPLRSRLFARIADLNGLGQPVRPLANLMLRGPAKWVMTGLGVHRARPLPLLAPTFSGWFRRTHGAADGHVPAGDRAVVLFHDTFMEHNNPEIGRAAVRVLEAAGYRVILVEKHKCCGRPAISKGLLDEAAALARHNIALLAPFARAGLPIVGCEPSCIAALVDDYLSLAPGEDAQAVARQSMLIDDFLAREAQEGRLQLPFDGTPRSVLLHGHCNQKALFGTGGTHAMLRLIPNCTVSEVDSSCCGMAGSFGYEAEHYDISMTLAEISLAPAIRSASTETIVAAPGTSCREQILHTTGRAPLHPIQVVAAALAEGEKAAG